MIYDTDVRTVLEQAQRRRADNQRICNGTVPAEEISQLEQDLLKMFLTKAKQEGRRINLITDADEYRRLRTAGAVFDSHDFCLLTDASHSNVLDMTPIAYHLMDTPEGNFYAKWITRPATSRA